jgi:hypothetical protein
MMPRSGRVASFIHSKMFMETFYVPSAILGAQCRTQGPMELTFPQRICRIN